VCHLAKPVSADAVFLLTGVAPSTVSLAQFGILGVILMIDSERQLLTVASRKWMVQWHMARSSGTPQVEHTTLPQVQLHRWTGT